MKSMFCKCKNLTYINLSSFYTKKVTNMSAMFQSCEKLTNLDLSTFDIQNVENANGIFHGCQKEIIEINSAIFKRFNSSELIKFIPDYGEIIVD